jgi:hypothetical protein
MSRPFLCPVGLRSPTLPENFETAKSLKTTNQPSHLKKRHRRYWRLTAQHYRSCSSGLVRTLQACCVETQGPSLVPSGAISDAMSSGYARSCVSGSECLLAGGRGRPSTTRYEHECVFRPARGPPRYPGPASVHLHQLWLSPGERRTRARTTVR